MRDTYSRVADRLQGKVRGGGSSIVNITSGGGGGVAGDYLLLDGTGVMLGNLNMGTNNIVNVGTINGSDIATLFANSHARVHNITSASDHTATGAALDIVGLSAANTLGILTPSSAPGNTSKILKSDDSGFLTLNKLTTPTVATASGALTLAPTGGVTQVSGGIVANRAVASSPGYVVPADLSYSFYLDGESTGGLFNAGVEPWGSSGFLAFNAYQVRPRPNDGISSVTNNMKFNGGGGLGSIYAHLQTFEGIGGLYKTYISASAPADGAGIAWTKLSELNGNGSYSVIGSLTAGTSVVATTTVSTPKIITVSGDLLLQPTSGAIKVTNSQTLVTQSFDSSFPTLGWRISETAIVGQSVIAMGVGVFDEMRVRVFVADETRVDRGNEFWTKSYGILDNRFTTPSALGGTVVITFEDSPALAGAIFSNNDWLLFQSLEIGTGLDLLNVWGQVAGYVDNTNGTQNWTFTLRQGPVSTLIREGQAGIDFGASGAGLIHLSTVDPNGAPYIKLRTWSGANPYNPVNYGTLVQIGNLESKSNFYYTPVGYGIYAQQPGDESRFFIIDNNGFQLRGADLKMFNGAVQTVNIDYQGIDFWIGQGAASKLLLFNGTSLSLLANNTPVITLDTAGNSYFASVMTIGLAGEIRQGTGTLGTNYTGLRIWRDTSIGRIAGYNNNVAQWYAGTDGLLYAGAGNVQLSIDGINLQQDNNVTPDAARAISWWASIGNQTGTPTQSISAYNVPVSFRNYLLLKTNAEAGYSGHVVLEAGSASIDVASTGIINFSGADVDMGGNDITDIGILGTVLTGLSFETGWANYGGSWSSGGYKRAGDIVFVSGLVTRTSGSATLIGYLPAGYRPSGNRRFLCATNAGYLEIDITPVGTVSIATGTYNSYVSLSGIAFSTL